ncbi:hypothetical protein JRQ81_001621 [Phrynocephalus forsythii]|uniref:Retinol dehydrogenase 7 n=1 Tax=Phrynocephalus forsythii TaxID=171643 RepID=A0A9Q0YAN3_9SAUR|nr:hypothetical protein JRQ81_001621 [Phrynocephalus forsythii]
MLGQGRDNKPVFRGKMWASVAKGEEEIWHVICSPRTYNFSVSLSEKREKEKDLCDIIKLDVSLFSLSSSPATLRLRAVSPSSNLCQRSQELLAYTSESLKAVLLNLTDPSSVDKAVEFVREETGNVGLYGLVNNAGRSMPMAPTDWMELEDFHTTLEVNLVGLIGITLKLLPLLKKSKGRIVNVSSVLGRLACIGGGYCVSKWGVEAFSDSLRRDMQYFGVKVSIIEPGFFKTGVTNLEFIERDLLRLWNQLPPEVRDSYGDKYFVEYLRMQRLFMNRLCDSDISKVTECMEHALTAKYPRTRYGVGWDAKLLWLPLSYMPTFLSDRMLKLFFPLPRGRRHPASRFQMDV